MNNATLQTAIDSAKMLMLMGRGLLTQAEVGFQRGRVDDAVYRLVRMGQHKDNSSEQRSLVAFLSNLNARLATELSAFDIVALSNNALATHARVKALNNERVTATTLSNVAASIRTIATVKTPQFDQMLEALDKKVKTPAGERGRILHTFGSVVRNDEWVSLLLALKVRQPVQLSTALMQEYSSGQGRNQREAKMATLVTVADNGKSTVAPQVLTVMVALTPKVAIQHAKVATLFSALMIDAANTDVVNSLLTQATTPQEVAIAGIDAFVQEQIDALVKGLAARQKTYKAEVEARRAAQAVKKEDDAVAALKGMGAHLAVLAANPKLLARALEQAGLAQPAATSAKAPVKKATKAAATTARKARS